MSNPSTSTRSRILGSLIRAGSIFLPLMGSEQTVLLLVGSLVGILLAFGALAFGALVDLISRLTFAHGEGRFSIAPFEEMVELLREAPWWWILLAALGIAALGIALVLGR